MRTLIKCKACGVETYYHQNGLCRDPIKDGGNNCYEKAYRDAKKKKNLKCSYDGEPCLSQE